MSSSVIRGQEATITLSLNGQIQTGSIFNVKDFKASAEFEIKKDSYIGQRVPKGNPSFSGYSGSFSIDEEDAKSILLAQSLIEAEEAGVAPPQVQLMVRYKYRKGGNAPVSEVYRDVVLAPKERSVPGQKENISSGFEFYAEKKLVVSV